MEDHTSNTEKAQEALLDLLYYHGQYSMETIDKILENVMHHSELETATENLTMAITCYMYHQRTGTNVDLEKSLVFLRDLEQKISQNIH